MAGFTGQSIIPQVNSTTGAVSMPSGFSLGVIGAGIQIGSILFPNIGAVLQAYRNDTDVSILSTPQLLTLNNEDAEINVGKNVPYLTRADTSAVIPGQTFGSSFEYKDVGVILKITPNINEEQFVRLKIDQQVTKLADLTADDDADDAEADGQDDRRHQGQRNGRHRRDDRRFDEHRNRPGPLPRRYPLRGLAVQDDVPGPGKDEPLYLHHPPRRPEPGGSRRHLPEEARRYRQRRGGDHQDEREKTFQKPSTDRKE